MKKVSKVIKFLIILLITIQAMNVNTVSMATTQPSFKFSANSNKATVKAGEEIKVQMQISDIDVGDIGINVIEGQLNYDTQIFETVRTNQFEKQNNWTITYSEQNKKDKSNFLLSNMVAGITEDQNVGIITLKVKQGIAPQKTKIEFKGITTNDGEQLIKGEDIAIEIEIIEDKEENNQQVNNPQNNKPTQEENTVGNVNNNGENTSIDNTKVDETNATNNNGEKAEHATATLGQKSEANLDEGRIKLTCEISIILVILILFIILIIKRRKKEEEEEQK